MLLINQYVDLERQIKERALHVNNLVANYTMDNEIDDDSYCFGWCNVFNISHLDLAVYRQSIRLEYDDGDSCPRYWDVPTKWLDMSDEDIIKDYLIELERRREIDKMTSIQKLERQANELGFCLVKQ